MILNRILLNIKNWKQKTKGLNSYQVHISPLDCNKPRKHSLNITDIFRGELFFSHLDLAIDTQIKRFKLVQDYRWPDTSLK